MIALRNPNLCVSETLSSHAQAGIIYVSETELGWSPVATSWLQTRRPAESAALKPFFDKFVEGLLSYLR